MKKVYLFCSGGMSTTILVRKMEDAAKEKGIEVEIAAFGIPDIEIKGKEADVALIAPQIRFKYDEIKEQLTPTPVILMEMQDYGLGRGEKILTEALEAIK